MSDIHLTVTVAEFMNQVVLNAVLRNVPPMGEASSLPVTVYLQKQQYHLPDDTLRAAGYLQDLADAFVRENGTSTG